MSSEIHQLLSGANRLYILKKRELERIIPWRTLRVRSSLVDYSNNWFKLLEFDYLNENVSNRLLYFLFRHNVIYSIVSYDLSNQTLFVRSKKVSLIQ